MADFYNLGERHASRKVSIKGTPKDNQTLGKLLDDMILLGPIAGIQSPHPEFDKAPFRVFRNGSSIFSNFDWSPPAEITGRMYYVDPVSGSNANNGFTPQTALQSINTAVVKPDRGRIMIRGGTGYLYRDSNWTPTAEWGTAPLSFEAYGGPVKWINGNRGDTLTWTLVGSGAYSTTLASSHAVLLTSSNDTNVAEIPLALTKRADVAALQAAAEGYFITGTTVNVKIPAGTTPGITTVFVLRNVNSIYCKAPVFYQRGIHWIGFASGFRHLLLSAGLAAIPTVAGSKSIHVDCVFSHTYCDQPTTGYNAFTLIGVEVTALKNCRGYYGGKDIFNYAVLQNSPRRAYVLEENCIGKYSAWGRAEMKGPYQASTTHNGMVAVRLNGTYGPTLGGPGVQDQGFDALDVNICRAWHLNCTLDATGSPNSVGEGSVNWGFPLFQGPYSSYWNDDCTLTSGGAGTVSALYSSGKAYFRNTNTWAAIPSGFVELY